MKITALAAAVSLALGGTLLAGCDRDGDRAASGGSSSSGTSGQRSEGSTSPGTAPKRPASPGGDTYGSK